LVPLKGLLKEAHIVSFSLGFVQVYLGVAGVWVGRNRVEEVVVLCSENRNTALFELGFDRYKVGGRVAGCRVSLS
jgi:hypothetical protein